MSADKKTTVLIVDDNASTRMLLRAIVREDERYVLVGEASNGTDAIEMALRLKPQIICLDNVMPKVSGLDVLQEVRPQLPGTVILMVTGSSDRETVQAAIQNGANGYIVKPFNAARVLAAMEHATAAMDANSKGQ
ncbi:MAG: response regulator [Rhodocyclaceae bacterium]|nr:MAG: response regulator [Rhodocyclaceae bacterium]